MSADDDNIVPLRPRPDASPDLVDRLTRIEAMVEPVAGWVTGHVSELAHDAAAERADLARRVADLEANLAEAAQRKELRSHPNPDVATSAEAVVAGSVEAVDGLADALVRTPGWWARHRMWVIPAAIGSAVVLTVCVAMVVREGRRARRLMETEEYLRAAEQRIRGVEQHYLATHAALVEARRALAGEQCRPLTATYDQRATHRHTHRPERVIEKAIPVPVDRIVERQPIVQPTTHTHEVREKTRVAYVDRVIERQPIVQPTMHTREVIREKRSRSRRKTAPLVCGRSKTLADEIAKAKRGC